MSNTIITPAARNRQHFLKALANGVAVLGQSCCGLYVSSASEPGTLHHVETTVDTNGVRSETCDCKWAERQGTFVDGDGKLVCSHILIARWYRLDPASKQNVIDTDPEIAAAHWAAAELAMVA